MKLERFHESADGKAVVQYHSQAETEFAKRQGYVVLRIEDWVIAECPTFARLVANVLNNEGRKVNATDAKAEADLLRERVKAGRLDNPPRGVEPESR